MFTFLFLIEVFLEHCHLNKKIIVKILFSKESFISKIICLNMVSHSDLFSEKIGEIDYKKMFTCQLS